MKKILLIVFGCLAGLFTLAQLLQLLGLIGIGPSVAGVGITAGGAAITFACFKAAFRKK